MFPSFEVISYPIRWFCSGKHSSYKLFLWFSRKIKYLTGISSITGYFMCLLSQMIRSEMKNMTINDFLWGSERTIYDNTMPIYQIWAPTVHLTNVTMVQGMSQELSLFQFSAVGRKEMSQESRNNSLRKTCINTRRYNMNNETK